MIFLEVNFLLFLLLKASELYYVVFIIATALNAVILVAIVNADVNPEYKVSWISVVMLLPFFGALLFVIFYKRRMTRKEIKIGREILEKLNTGGRKCDEFALLGSRDSRAAGQAMAIMNDDPSAEVYTRTEAVYFADGEEMYRSMLADMSSAEKFIFLEYFIIKDGEMWQGIHSVLKRKVECGVEVRILYDDIGCMSSVQRRSLRALSEEGIKCYPFARVNPSLSTVHNNRDHRKICVVDGTVAYTGGINIADEYINKEERFGHWKDGGVRLYGDAARGFVKLYLQNWSFNKRECEDFFHYIDAEEHNTGSDDEFFVPFGSGPSPIYRRSVGKAVFLNIINQSERYVYITTPYLIIDFDLTEALRGAALRGVDVRIITPAVADKKLVKILTKSAYPYLIEAGVKIYEYTPGFIHEKLVVADDKYTVIGSINLDYRSLAHHFECAVWIYSGVMAVEARDGFMNTAAKSELMNESAARLRPSERIVKSLVKFIAPLL